MRISDWSSDVCSSDLRILDRNAVPIIFVTANSEPQSIARMKAVGRSEERRVGKECVRTGRSRRSQYHVQKQIDTTNDTYDRCTIKTILQDYQVPNEHQHQIIYNLYKYYQNKTS